MTLTRRPGSAMVTVADDGIGFDPTAQQSGTGITSIHDRLQQLDGAAELNSGHGRGTRLTLTVPLPSSGDTAATSA